MWLLECRQYDWKHLGGFNLLLVNTGQCVSSNCCLKHEEKAPYIISVVNMFPRTVPYILAF